MNTLTDVGTKDLINELGKRFDTFICLGVRNEGLDDGGVNTFYDFTGENSVSYGMCSQLSFIIMEKMIEEKMCR